MAVRVQSRHKLRSRGRRWVGSTIIDPRYPGGGPYSPSPLNFVKRLSYETASLADAATETFLTAPADKDLIIVQAFMGPASDATPAFRIRQVSGSGDIYTVRSEDKASCSLHFCPLGHWKLPAGQSAEVVNDGGSASAYYINLTYAEFPSPGYRGHSALDPVASTEQQTKFFTSVGGDTLLGAGDSTLLIGALPGKRIMVVAGYISDNGDNRDVKFIDNNAKTVRYRPACGDDSEHRLPFTPIGHFLGGASEGLSLLNTSATAVNWRVNLTYLFVDPISEDSVAVDTGFFILDEDGFFVLAEDGCFIRVEVAEAHILAEDGGHILAEDGDLIDSE